MKTDNQILTEDIIAIQRSISTFKKSKAERIVESGYQANIRMQYSILGFAFALIITEVLGKNILTETILEKNFDLNWRIAGVVLVCLFMAASLAIGYFSVKKAAADINDDLDVYVKRNFSYLSNQSHSYDFFIKLVVVSGLILGQKPEWISTFLFVCIADYLFQGRYFTLKPGVGRGLGFFSLVLAAVQIHFSDVSLIWPFTWFFVVNIYSLVFLKSLKRVED